MSTHVRTCMTSTCPQKCIMPNDANLANNTNTNEVLAVGSSRPNSNVPPVCSLCAIQYCARSFLELGYVVMPPVSGFGACVIERLHRQCLRNRASTSGMAGFGSLLAYVLVKSSIYIGNGWVLMYCVATDMCDWMGLGWDVVMGNHLPVCVCVCVSNDCLWNGGLLGRCCSGPWSRMYASPKEQKSKRHVREVRNPRSLSCTRSRFRGAAPVLRLINSLL